MHDTEGNTMQDAEKKIFSSDDSAAEAPVSQSKELRIRNVLDHIWIAIMARTKQVST